MTSHLSDGPTLLLRQVKKRFNALDVLDGVSIEVADGEILAIVGPSGSGKTTLLNIMTGLIEADSGSVQIASGLEFGCGISYMMQESVLLPWRTLWQNATLALEVNRNSSADAGAALCESLFKDLDLFELREVSPEEASGGMSRRVAFIRALLTQPKLLLLDEPFASLDYDVKIRAQRLLLQHGTESGTTVILVTHDIEDALVLADRILVLSEKPSYIKAEVAVDRPDGKRDPVESRASAWFPPQFRRILEELRYLDG